MTSPLSDLDARSREIFRLIVETYLETGEPLGSRNLSRLLPMQLSPASVRNVMSDLEHLGLICAPHTSAGRLPTEQGLRFFDEALAGQEGVAGFGAAFENTDRLRVQNFHTFESGKKCWTANDVDPLLEGHFGLIIDDSDD